MPATRRIVRPLAALAAAGLAIVIVASSLITRATPTTTDTQPSLPLRAAFYYPWFPEAWKQQGVEPYTNYHPSLGYYNLSDQAIVRQHIDAMQYGNVQAGISSWWGQNSNSDQRLPILLGAAVGTPFRWSIYYEPESQGDPDVGQLTADLTYLRDRYGSDPSYLRLDGRFVVFVYADPADGCGMVDRWLQANTVDAYLVLKVFEGYRDCASQPDGWHQYGPAAAEDQQLPYSYTISPGFHKVGEPERLNRDLDRWRESVRAMVGSGAAFQLITTFNEWGEGTAIESAAEWPSPSGYGAYLDVLHTNGATEEPPAQPTDGATEEPPAQPTDGANEEPPAQPTLTTLPSTPTPLGEAPTPLLSTVTFLADADARVKEANPGTNYGRSSYLQADGISTPDIEAYLRFTVSGVSNIVQSAKVRIYITTNDTKNGPAIYTTDANWSETGIVWSNRPQRTSGEIANIDTVGTNTWVEYDVTPIVTGDGTYSFALIPDSADGITISSREGSVPPELVLTLAASAGTPTPTLMPTSIPPTSVPPTPAPPSPTPTNGAADAVLLAAGDIASCSSSGDEATAKLLNSPADAILTLGDNVYDDGTASEFANCFHPSWGQYKARIRPSVGNHEYHTAGASGYFNYYGAVAGDPKQGYYSYDLGAWHIIALNSNCTKVGGCDTGSPQEQWLRADLAAHPATCTLAYWHHPRFSSGEHGSTTAMQPFWQALYDAGVELVLSGHDHNYERFAPQDPVGRSDPTRGIRQFVVGTGGKNHYSVTAPIANSEVHNDNTFGVIKLTLQPDHYDWEFIPEAGRTYTDSGTSSCH